jgi:hypothetical protein
LPHFIQAHRRLLPRGLALLGHPAESKPQCDHYNLYRIHRDLMQNAHSDYFMGNAADAVVGLEGDRNMGKTVLWITLIVVVAVLALQFFFDIDAIGLTKGFLSWLYDLLWGNRGYR